MLKHPEPTNDNCSEIPLTFTAQKLVSKIQIKQHKVKNVINKNIFQNVHLI